jgi:hypothetical protein
MVRLVVGTVEKPQVIYVHSFLAGKRKEEMRVPTEITDPKTGKVRQGWRCVADGALKDRPKAGKRTT